ncbi:hypothetical protein Sste5346_000537 [Sporothrix stenoceras]|uniref:Cwf18 pre-mRNA splicing factor n=1 Tax=Sporothrix stenoceras TaxID=5173 RepID=A0ABR3ZST4_9PEZI
MSSRAALSAAADDRKARLAKLRSIKRKQPDDEIVPPESDRASPAVVALPQGQDDEIGEAGETEESVERDVSRLHLSGRNYDPESRGARLGFEAPPNLAAGDDTLEAKAAKLEAEVRRKQQEEEGIVGDDGGEDEGGDAQQQRDSGGKPIDLFKLQPKKPNWDLKRELNKRLEPLNARTDNAIGKLVRERLAAKQQAESSKSAKVAASGGEADESSLEGAALVEGIRLREQEAEEEERRERELENEDDA